MKTEYILPETENSGRCPKCQSLDWFEWGDVESGYIVICRECDYKAPPEYFHGLNGNVRQKRTD